MQSQKGTDRMEKVENETINDFFQYKDLMRRILLKKLNSTMFSVQADTGSEVTLIPRTIMDY